jgi:osmotically inducible protein OsmC
VGVPQSQSRPGSSSFLSRFEDGERTNPEELIAAAHAGCYAMALSNDLASDGHESERVHAEANVHLDMERLTIDSIELVVEASVPSIEEATFMEYAEGAKENCPVSCVLAGAEVSLDVTVLSYIFTSSAPTPAVPAESCTTGTRVISF